MYAHPAAANYHAGPSHRHQAQRGYRLCDHCSSAESSSGPKFRLCGGCMTTQYCSQDCQRANWPSHKAICQHTAAQVSAMKHQHQQPQHSHAYADENVAKCLRKFASAHQDLLSWSTYQALNVKRLPSNIRANCLIVDLAYHGNGSESHRKFSIKGTHIVPRSYIMDPLVTADIQRRDDRCRRLGGIGTAVVVVQCGAASQVMPIEIDPPAKIGWDTREDWAGVLNHFVQTGNTDFRPISTTSRGVHYG